MKLALLIYYSGPNRRSERTMIEAVLSYEAGEPEALARGWEHAVQKFQQVAKETGCKSALEGVALPETVDEPMAAFCNAAASIALKLQNSTGHVVSSSFSLLEPDQQLCRFVFDHEDYIVGQKAAIFALRILNECFPNIEIDYESHNSQLNDQELFEEFESYSTERVQPADTTAIIEAAGEQGVPVIKLERGPYEGAKGDFRLRMNSMLMLGHTSHLQVIDGTFALEKSAPAYQLLFDRQKVRQAALALKIPVPEAGRDMQALISAQRTVKVVGELGYPVVIKTANRRKPGGTTLNISQPGQIAGAVAHAMKFDNAFVVEKFIQGETWKLLVANHELIAVFSPKSGRLQTGDISESTMQMAIEASQALNVGLLEMTLVTTDISSDLQSTGGAFVDIELAPRLDELLGEHPKILETAAEHFVRWLVPAGEGSRVPIVAVTGTNGKTTTCRMLAHITQTAGQVTGLQCTDGRFINGELVEEGDNSIFVGHYRVFEEKNVDVAVLEAHLRGIAVFGLAFDRCDVAICTNVTQDHVGEEMIHSIDEIASIKQFLVERATDTAVLNADNAESLSMLPAVKARRSCLVSMDKSADELETLSSGNRYSCTLESRDNSEWIVLNEGESSMDIISVKSIPATFDGRARMMVENAMHAIAGAHAMGQPVEAIRTAMATFSNGVNETPWRLNFYEGLPFQVLVDYAHNPDGALRMAEFVSNIGITGRTIVAFSGDRHESNIEHVARNLAGSFDHYVVKEYDYPEGTVPVLIRDPGVKAAIARSALLESGVSEDQVSVVLNEMKSVRFALDHAKPGDLVVLLLGKGELPKMPAFMAEYIENFPATTE